MRKTAVALIASLLVGCASVPVTYAPVVDTQDVDVAKYQIDLRECQQYADQIDAARNAANGALIGAVIGVGVGLLFGLRGKDLAQVAGVGALSGGVNVAAESGRTVIQIVQNCMGMRGYKVLG